MEYFLLPFFFFFSIFPLFINLITPLPSLLSLNCTPSPPEQTNAHHHYRINPIKALLHNLTSEAPNSQLTTALGPEQYTGLVQCRTGLGPKNCTVCAETAQNTVLNHCKNSIAVSAWFDGCYVLISSTNSNSDINAFVNKISHHSCSGRAKNHDPTRFLPALETLLLKLRADVRIATHHGFSHGEITYENINFSDSKIYGLVECVRLLSPQKCDSCIANAIDELYFYCGGKNGGTVVYGQCVVRFDSNEFYHAEDDQVNVSARNFTVWEGEINGGSKKKVVMVMACWSGGVSCFVVVVFLALLLRRNVLNRAKVGPPGSADFDEK